LPAAAIAIGDGRRLPPEIIGEKLQRRLPAIALTWLHRCAKIVAFLWLELVTWFFFFWVNRQLGLAVHRQIPGAVDVAQDSFVKSS